jgi:TPR repeat protein
MSKWRQLWLLFRAHVIRDVESLHDIAAHYASAHEAGLLPRKYYNKAFRYYRQGAERGNPACQYDYGFILIIGDAGVKEVL